MRHILAARLYMMCGRYWETGRQRYMSGPRETRLHLERLQQQQQQQHLQHQLLHHSSE